MTDKVKPLKLESSVDGTQTDPFPRELDPSEDYVATKGVAFEDRDDIRIESIAGELVFRDTKNIPITLKQILDSMLSGINFNYNFIKTNETLTIPESQQMIVHGRLKVYGKLIIKGDLITKKW